MPQQPQYPGPKVTLKRGNKSVVAGSRCIDWSWTEDVDTRTVCVTADGVLLRFLVNGKIVTEARSVNYSPQSTDLFHVPSDYAPLRPPKAAPRRNLDAVDGLPPQAQCSYADRGPNGLGRVHST